MADDDQKLRVSRGTLEGLDDEPTEAVNRRRLGDLLDSSFNQLRRESEEEEQEDAAAEDIQADSETLIGAAPTSEASGDPPTVENRFGARPADDPPEAAGVDDRRSRTDAGTFPAQPPPLPNRDGSPPAKTPARRSEEQPSPAPDAGRRRRQRQSKQPASAASPPGDLRPRHAQPDRRWQLTDTPLSSVSLQMASRCGVALLEVRSGPRRAQIVIEDGQIFDIRLLPSSKKRSLTALLERANHLEAHQAERVRRYARHHDTTEAHTLLARPELVAPSRVRAAMCSRIRYLLRRLLDAQLTHAESYRFDHEPTGAEMIVSVPVVGIVFAHLRARHRGKYSGRRNYAEAGYRGMQLSRRLNLAFSINRLDLKLHERQLIDRVLARPRSFQKILHNSPMPENETVATLAALEAMRLLEIQPAGVANDSSSSWAEDYENTVERIEMMETRLDRENDFAIYSLHWTTYDSEIDRRYNELSEVFELTNQPLGLSARERERIRRVHDRLDDIFERLRDRDRREQYRQKLVSRRTRQTTARRLEALADAALSRKMFHSALDYYQRLLEADPHNARASRVLPVLLSRTSRG